MKNKLMISMAILATVLMACGGQATVLPSDSATPLETQLTQVPRSTDTSEPANPTSSTAAPAGSVSFANDVMPIFQASCFECHGVKQIRAGLDLRTYDTILGGSFNHLVVSPGDSEGSLLIQQLVNGKMPKQGAKLTDEQIKIIADWIDEGAPNN
jgi:mono/diheme cytochrome c family protein